MNKIVKNMALKVPKINKLYKEKQDLQNEVELLEKKISDLKNGFNDEVNSMLIQKEFLEEQLSDLKIKIDLKNNELENKKILLDETNRNLENLSNENKNLKEEMLNLQKWEEELEKDNKRVYAGHAGLMEEINFLKFRINELDILHDEVVERYWKKDNNMQKYICLYPFERIDILPRGEVYTCCSGYIKHNFYIGNIYEQSFDEIWNSEKAKKLRYSVTKGNFEYCTHRCKWLHQLDDNLLGTGGGGFKETVTLNPIRLRKDYNFNYKNYEECILEDYPKAIILTCDETCNLTCVSCRTHLNVMNKEKSIELYNRLVNTIKPLLKDCELLGALSSGEFFASYAVSNFYKLLSHNEFPKLKLYIITNGQLLTQKKWEEFSNLEDIPLRLGISIDASRKETYEKLRKGASWEVLCDNLKYISELRAKNIINSLYFNFVVQKENYKQMKEFIEFAKLYNVDTVEFQRLGNWGTFEQNLYIENDVFHINNKFYISARNILEEIINSESEVTIVQNIF